MATQSVDLKAEQTVTVIVTDAEAIALNATAKTLIAAQGANRAVQVTDIFIEMDGVTAFDGIAAGEDLVVRYNGETDALVTVETTGFLDQVDRPSRRVKATYSTTVIPIVNTAVELANSGAITDGSQLTVTIRYRELVDVKAVFSIGTNDFYYQAKGGSVEITEKATVPTIGTDPSIFLGIGTPSFIHKSATGQNLYAWALSSPALLVGQHKR